MSGKNKNYITVIRVLKFFKIITPVKSLDFFVRGLPNILFNFVYGIREITLFS
jgi:hypothetical protein